MKLGNPFRSVWDSSVLYPIKGFLYFASHRTFWPLFRTRLIPIVLLSTFIIVNLFLWTYIPQALFLAIWQGPTAWLNATFLVLSEGAAIVALLFEAFFVDETLVDVFDAVLINEGLSDLVAQARTINQDGTNAVQKLGKPTMSSVYSPFSLRQIVEFIILLPLNFIPVVGVPIFLVSTGYRAGPFHHWRYFKMLDLTKKERKAYVRERKVRYTFFGTIALLLQLVPVLSMFFLLTTAAGSALWVVKMEKARRAREPHMAEPDEEYLDGPV